MLKAIFIASAGFLSMGLVFFYITRHIFFIKVAVLSIAIFSVSIVTGNKLIAFILIAMIGGYLVRSEPENFLIYFVALLPVFPVEVNWIVSAPGIDVLIDLNHIRILSLFILLPIAFKILSVERSIVDPLHSHSGVVDRLVLVYIFFEMLTFFRDLNVLVAGRYCLQIIIDIWIPYFVVSRSLRRFNEVLVVFLYSAAALSVISLLESLSWFRVYDLITIPMGEQFTLPKVRSGMLRAYASMANPLALGFFYSLPLLIAYRLGVIIRAPVYSSILITGIVLVGLFSTGSRSPILANVIGLGILYWWQMGKPFVEKTAKVALFVAILVLIWFFSGGIKHLLALDDDQGTFFYRYELLLNSMHLVLKNPIFGTSPRIYLNDPVLLGSLQGEGIIDLTNTYLLIALKSGLIAMFAFLGVWLMLMRGLYRAEIPEYLASLLMGICVVNVIMLFMTSPINFVYSYMWLLAAIVCGLIRYYSGMSKPIFNIS